MGSEKSGNRRPINRIPIFATVEMLDLLRSLPNKKGLPYRNLIMKDFLEAHKEEFIALNGEESYNEHLEKYSLNTTEMQLRKNEKKKEADKKREERLKLKRDELDLKRRELDLREKNSDMRNEGKIEEREQEDKEDLFRLVENFNASFKAMPRKSINAYKFQKNVERLRGILDRIHKIDPEKASELESKLLPLESLSREGS